MTQTDNTRNPLAAAALGLGIAALILSVVVLGGLLGIAAIVAGILAMRRPAKRGMAIAGIILGALSIPLMVLGLLIAILLPSLGKARERAKETVTMTRMRGVSTALTIYSAEWNGAFPAQLGQIEPYVATPDMLLDARGTTPPLSLPPGSWKDHPADVEAHCDFYYATAGTKLTAVRSIAEFITLYDKRSTDKGRLVAFADGHVERLAAGSSELAHAVERANRQRAMIKLSPLPLNLDGPPSGPPMPLPVERP